MKMYTFESFFLDSMKNLKRNMKLTILSVINISATFFIIGLFLLYFISLNKNSESIFIYNKSIALLLICIQVVVLVILPPISLLLIINGLKMSVFSRMCEISIMKSIGATDWFIRWPFIIEGLVIGIVGAFVANFSLFFTYSLIYSKAMFLFTEGGFIEPIFIIKNMLFPFVLYGAFIVPIGNIIALRKPLNSSVLEANF